MSTTTTTTRSTPTPVTRAIRRAGRHDAADVVATLSLAFQADPVFGWAIPDAAARRQALPGAFALFAEAYLPHGATDIAFGGVAMWSPPGVEPVGDDEIESFLARMADVVGADADRVFAIAELTSSHRPTEPSAHLQFLGVEPDLQGQGLGSALLVSKLAGFDRDGVPAHLDATSEGSRALYERHGFEVVEELRVADAPPLWSMWRAPRS